MAQSLKFSWAPAPLAMLLEIHPVLGGEAYAGSEMMGHVALLREFRAPLANPSPGTSALDGRESLFTALKTERADAEKYLVRHLLSIQLAWD